MDNEQIEDENLSLEAEQPKEQEKMLTQTEVNRIVQTQKARAKESGIREAEERYKQQLESLNSRPDSIGGMSQDIDQIKNAVFSDLMSELQRAAEQEENEKQKAEIERVAREYHTKMSTGKEYFEDFEEVTKGFNPAAFPNTVYLATLADNTPQVMYELAKNPSKRVDIETLSRYDPEEAKREMAKLSKSIKDNEEAKKQAEQQQVNDPLSRLKPSNIGADNGNMSIKDFKNSSWLRG